MALAAALVEPLGHRGALHAARASSHRTRSSRGAAAAALPRFGIVEQPADPAARAVQLASQQLAADQFQRLGQLRFLAALASANRVAGRLTKRSQERVLAFQAGQCVARVPAGRPG